jgi:hypothetical protein
LPESVCFFFVLLFYFLFFFSDPARIGSST